MTQPGTYNARRWLSPGILVVAAVATLTSAAACTSAPVGETSSGSGTATTATPQPASRVESPKPATNLESRGQAKDSAPLQADGASAPDDACSDEQGWGTGRETGSTALTPASLYRVRAGQHDCYDRVVFDLNGPEDVGYSIAYTRVVRTDGDGAPVRVDGNAALEVVVMGMVQGTDQLGHQPWASPPDVGQDMVAQEQLADWAALTQVAFAGSFEGQSTFAVGVRDERPFRVWTSDEERGYRRIVLDIAH